MSAYQQLTKATSSHREKAIGWAGSLSLEQSCRCHWQQLAPLA